MITNPTLRVTPHPTGDWIVEVRGRRLAVSPMLGGALLSLSGAEVDERLVGRRLEAALRMDAGAAAQVAAALLAEPGTASGADRGRIAGLLSAWRARGSGRRALWLRVPLIPARWTVAGAFGLRPLTAWPGLGALAAVGTVGYASAWFVPPVAGKVDAAGLGAVLALFFLTALWHEFGHATALAYEGYPPGGIGVGVLFVLPVLFADVTLLGALSRRGRLRVDVAGVCFQLGLGGAFCLAGAWLPAARTAAWLALFAVAWSLLPFVRSDGYWALSDLVGVQDLRAGAPAGSGRGVRLFVSGFRISSWLFLALVCFTVVVRIGRWSGLWLV